MNYVKVISGGFRGAAHGPKFSQFHAVFRKIWQNHMLAPPGGLAPPPTGNPGPATGDVKLDSHLRFIWRELFAKQ